IWPLPFGPQQYPTPPVVTPHVWNAPPLTRPDWCPPCTRVGTVRASVVLSPSRPPLAPQQYAAPAGVTAHVWTYPASSLANVTPAGALAWTGVGASMIVLSPSWPAPPFPQQYTAPLPARPQLWTAPVVTAVHGTAGGEGAAVPRPSAYRSERDTGRCSDPNGGRAVGERAVSEAPEFVSPPAIRIAGRCDRAGVLPAGSDGLESDARRGLDQSGDIPNGLGVVAELAATVESPAVDIAGGGDTTGM